MSTPRQTHYQFAHQLLAYDAHQDAGVFDRLEHQAAPYLAARWQQVSGSPQLPPEVFAFPLVRVPLHGGAVELGVRVVRMPRPENVTEAHFVAFVRDPRAPMPLRFFVAERSTDPGRAVLAEWRAGPQPMRIRYADLQHAIPPGSGPVSTQEPFLDDFVRAVAQASAEGGGPVAAAQAMPGGMMQGGYGPGAMMHPGQAAGAVRVAPAQAARKGGSAGWIVAIVVVVGLGGGYYLYDQQQTKKRIAAYRKNEARIAEVIERIDEAKGTPGVDRCTADVRKRILASRQASSKTKAPATLPTAQFVCDDGSDAPNGRVGGSCMVPDGVKGPKLRDDSLCFADTAATRAELDELKTTDKPWGGMGDEPKIDAWEEKVDEALESLEETDRKVKAPSVLAVGGGECHTYVAAKFVSDRTGEVREVHGYDCDVALTWVDAKGQVLGQMRASGRGKPDDAVANAQTLQAEDIERSNRNAQHRALDEAWTKVGKVIAKGG